MKDERVQYGAVHSAEELGSIARSHRKKQGHTLAAISAFGNLGTRFLSELERGKTTAELGKVLKALQTLGLEVVIQPRSWIKGTPPQEVCTMADRENLV